MIGMADRGKKSSVGHEEPQQRAVFGKKTNNNEVKLKIQDLLKRNDSKSLIFY